ncbi:LysR substrate-binding domain-containing protein [Mycolicibacterium sp. CH28]|uniref:LysR substrate-binding domain-containing protein n=1 Tax=Mycolicibacterium sp. CH28 TaxID=2512237 RepID=UPI001386633D|nr:LysR substrate-binding domain-containing protein [Mycolicibacterium sp. CH28]
MITYPSSSALRSHLDAAIAESGSDVTVNYVANDVRLQIPFARQGVGVAICADSGPARQDCPDLVIRSLTPTVDFDKILVWRNDIEPNAPQPANRREAVASEPGEFEKVGVDGLGVVIGGDGRRGAPPGSVGHRVWSC